MNINRILLFTIGLLTVFTSAHAGPMVPNRISYLDISFFSNGCGQGGFHMEINHNLGIVSGYTLGCLNNGLGSGDRFIGSIGNSPWLGTSISISLPNRGEMYLIDDNPKKWHLVKDLDKQLKIIESGDYSLGSLPF